MFLLCIFYRTYAVEALKKNQIPSRLNSFLFGRQYFGEIKKDLIASRMIEYFNSNQEFPVIMRVISNLRKALIAKRISTL